MTKYMITNSQTQRLLGIYRATCVQNAIVAAQRATGHYLFMTDLDVVPTSSPVCGPEDQAHWEKRTAHLRGVAA